MDLINLLAEAGGSQLIDIIDEETLELKQAVQAGIMLLAIVFIGFTWAKSKALVPTVGAIIVASIVIFVVSDTGRATLARLVGDEIDEPAQTTTGPGSGGDSRPTRPGQPL